ncbi:glycoside hydrolase family 98 domain-containing protein [Catenovulum adriaticum]|uniref:Uncharacterized protein n=1 Tax=Catenovulum adriaticum TaxID=2984846 RepID=A0ABY7AS02_9ALTE|nr:glycoside hydrolase family 98 domain-containing protein [Catenovulum sp. TS8]WAJ71901.1 hypothetical protein OLW01_14325 [Catenovulum sp. TS8]
MIKRYIVAALLWVPMTALASSSITVELEKLQSQNNFAPLAVQTDTNAANQQYVVWPNAGNQALTTPNDSATGQVEVTFNLSDSSDLILQMRANMSNSSDDSFYYKLNNGSWSYLNNTTTNGWENLQVASFNNLASGNHTLRILRREDGTQLDNITLTAATGIVTNVNAESLVSNDFRRPLSPQSPMYLVHVSLNVGDEPQEIIDAIPVDMRPYVVLNLNPVGTTEGTTEGYLLMREWLQESLDNDMWAMVQPSSGIRNRMDNSDTSNYEKLYQDYPNLIGYNWSEQTWGYDTNTFAQRLDLLSDLLELSDQYGGFVYVNDAMSISQPGWNTIAKFKSHQRFKNTAQQYSDHFIIGNKTTHGWGYFDNESMALGAFLAGYADHYAIRYDQYSWVWSGKGQLFGDEGTREEMEEFGSITWFTSPEGLMGTHIAEHLLLTGATVIDGPEVEWASGIFEGQATPNFNNIMIDILRKVVDGNIVIPTRKQVADRTKFALISDGSENNTPTYLYTGLYRMNNDGEHQSNRRWLKKTGRYPTIPYMVGTPAEASSYSLILDQSDYSTQWSSQSAKVAAFDSMFPAESTGDMFVSRVGNNWLAYNPYMNTNANATGEFNLKYNTCSSIEMDYTPHTFSVIKEAEQSIRIYLNNYRTDKSALWAEYPEGFSSWRLQNYVLPDFVANPTDSILRTSEIIINGCSSQPDIKVTERGTHDPSNVTTNFQNGEFTITVAHNGPIDLFVSQATGNNSRPTTPADREILKPASPSVVTPQAQGVWLEAECGISGSLWTLPASSTAAQGRYATITSGNNSVASAPTTDGQISLPFSLTGSGTYDVWARVRAPSTSDDSFWFKFNSDNFTSWNNLAVANEWTWKKMTTTTLGTGNHNLTLAYREDGADIDKVFIGTGAPYGYGVTSSNTCN